LLKISSEIKTTAEDLLTFLVSFGNGHLVNLYLEPSAWRLVSQCCGACDGSGECLLHSVFPTCRVTAL